MRRRHPSSTKRLTHVPGLLSLLPASSWLEDFSLIPSGSGFDPLDKSISMTSTNLLRLFCRPPASVVRVGVREQQRCAYSDAAILPNDTGATGGNCLPFPLAVVLVPGDAGPLEWSCDEAPRRGGVSGPPIFFLTPGGGLFVASLSDDVTGYTQHSTLSLEKRGSHKGQRDLPAPQSPKRTENPPSGFQTPYIKQEVNSLRTRTEVVVVFGLL